MTAGGSEAAEGPCHGGPCCRDALVPGASHKAEGRQWGHWLRCWSATSQNQRHTQPNPVSPPPTPAHLEPLVPVLPTGLVGERGDDG